MALAPRRSGPVVLNDVERLLSQQHALNKPSQQTICCAPSNCTWPIQDRFWTVCGRRAHIDANSCRLRFCRHGRRLVDQVEDVMNKQTTVMNVRAANLTLRIDDQTLLDNADFGFEVGNIVAVLGPSGSGKTTLLRALAGLHPQAAGRLFIDGIDVTHMRAEERPLAMLFQDPALFPDQTLEVNALAAIRAQAVTRNDLATAQAFVGTMIDYFDMSDHRDKPVRLLSGGERQRASIVRCLTNAQTGPCSYLTSRSRVH